MFDQIIFILGLFYLQTWATPNHEDFYSFFLSTWCGRGGLDLTYSVTLGSEVYVSCLYQCGMNEFVCACVCVNTEMLICIQSVTCGSRKQVLYDANHVFSMCPLSRLTCKPSKPVGGCEGPINADCNFNFYINVVFTAEKPSRISHTGKQVA